MTKKTWMIAGLIIVVGIAAAGMILPKKKTAVVETKTAGISPKAVGELYEQAAALRQKGEMMEAKQVYKQISSEYPDYEKIESVQTDLEDLNMRIIFSNAPAPQAVMHEVQIGDTLGKLAKKYGTTVELIRTSNNLKDDAIRVGQKLRVWTGKFNVLVDKSQNVLLLKDGEEVIKVYKVSTGKDNSTPVGTFKVTSKLTDPVWFNRGAVVPPDSPQNVLGSRWLGFDIPGYGIHGTIEPETIGQQVTAGCVRMLNRDVEQLYSLLPLGTEVVIVD